MRQATKANSVSQLVVLAVILLAMAAGCASRGQTTSNAPVSQVRPRSTAVLAIVTPTPGSLVSGTKLRVKLSLVGARIIAETTTRLAPDEGHVHLLIDGKVVSMTYGLDQEVEIAKGTHLLQAEFVANDHFPFNPRIIVAAPFIAQ